MTSLGECQSTDMPTIGSVQATFMDDEVKRERKNEDANINILNMTVSALGQRESGR